MTVRTETRRGERRWLIDIRYSKPDGTRGRFRRYAEVQTLTAARAEDRRRLMLLATTGYPFERAEVEPEGASSEESPEPEEMRTFESVAKDYLEQFAPSHLKPSTRAGYRKVIEAHLIPVFGALKLDEIDAAAVRKLDAKLQAKKRRPSTRRNVQLVLRSILRRYAVEARILDVAPQLPKLPKSGATITTTLMVDEVKTLLEASSAAERVAFMLGGYAGLRAGEIRGLRWRDLNLVQGMLVVRRSICQGEVAAPKSGHERLVPLVRELREALEEIAERPLDAPVTRGPRKPWTDWSLNKAFVRACRRAGLQRTWRLHDLRHFFVTSLFRANLPAPLVQKLAGHEHLATTQRYAHLVELDLAGVASAFERVTRGASGVTPAEPPPGE